MSVLVIMQYQEIVFKSMGFSEIEDISAHFLSEYKKVNTDNPKFLEKLKKVISDLKTKCNEQIKLLIEKDEKCQYKNPDGTLMEKKDYLTRNFAAFHLGVGLIGFPHGYNKLNMNKIFDIEKAYEMFLGKINNVSKLTVLKKIEWKGELKEFAELIFELDNKQWIDLPHGELTSIVNTLCSCFDFSATKKTEKSKTESSLLQYLKPSEREDKIKTKRYISKFDSIKQNTIQK